MYYFILIWVLLGLVNLLLAMRIYKKQTNIDVIDYDKEDFNGLSIAFASGPIATVLLFMLYLAEKGLLDSFVCSFTRIYMRFADIGRKIRLILATPIKFTDKDG